METQQYLFIESWGKHFSFCSIYSNKKGLVKTRVLLPNKYILDCDYYGTVIN